MDALVPTTKETCIYTCKWRYAYSSVCVACTKGLVPNASYAGYCPIICSIINKLMWQKDKLSNFSASLKARHLFWIIYSVNSIAMTVWQQKLHERKICSIDKLMWQKDKLSNFSASLKTRHLFWIIYSVNSIAMTVWQQKFMRGH